MRKWIIAAAVLVAASNVGAFAQSGRYTGTGSKSGSMDSKPMTDAPVGHRQPRAGDVPDEKNLSNPNDPMNKEDAALDRKIKSICRGC
jgi:hypothetical protein